MPNLGTAGIPAGARPALYQEVGRVGGTMVEPVTAMMKRVSEENSWFIYNVGPWSYKQEMASMGAMVIQSLDESLVLGDKGSAHEFAVAGPLVVEGTPSETYPGERKASRDYFAPMVDDPGFLFAKEICDVGKNRKDLIKRGVFISRFVHRYQKDGKLHYRAPSQPDSNDKESVAQWRKWCSEVKAAQQEFRKRCEYLCSEANFFASKKQDYNICEPHWTAARLLKKTTAQCPWMDGSSESNQNEPCPMCGEPIKPNVIFCAHCKQQVVSDEVKEARLAEIKARKAA